MNLNLSQVRLLKYLDSTNDEVHVKDCEMFMVSYGVSLSSARKYIACLGCNGLIEIQPSDKDRRKKVVILKDTIAGRVDSLI